MKRRESKGLTLYESFPVCQTYIIYFLERASVDVTPPLGYLLGEKTISKRKFYSTRQELIEFIIIKKLAILRLSRKPAGAQTVNLFRELEKIESSCSLREDI